jgi:hypothetical protein
MSFMKTYRVNRIRILAIAAVSFPLLLISERLFADDPPVINPFGPAPSQREDAVPGYVEMSDGRICAGQVFLTRDARLKINDEQVQREREVPLTAIKQIDCTVKKEWMEKEWKFKELTADEKMYTGRSYPSREYVHTITLKDGRTITGPLSAIVYVEPPDYAKPKPGEFRPEVKTEKFVLNKRNKGEIGQDLKSLVYPKSFKLGKEAFEEGLRRIAEKEKSKSEKEKKSTRK